MFAEINIWFDVVFWLALCGISAALLGAYVPANLIAGRLQDRFLRNKWWYLQAMHEPLPEEYANVVLQRTWHWINLISFLVFFVTGFYIRYPWFDGGREIMRSLHLLFAYINIINYLVRITWTLTGPDKKNFKFDRSDIKTFIENGKYYAFLASSYPHEKKFHPMQRATYIGMAALFPLMIYSGAVLVWPVLISPVSGLFGGEATAVAAMRLLHAAVFRVYLLIVIAHGFMGFCETFPTLKFFWFGIHIPQEIEHHGHGDHGDHGDGHESHHDDHGHGQHLEEHLEQEGEDLGHSRPEAAF